MALRDIRRWPEAAHAYKRLLLAARDDDMRALALWRLAHVYEARKLFLSARDSYLDLQARFPGCKLQGSGTPATVGELRRGRAGARALRPPRRRPRRSRDAGPLVRRWHWQPPTSQPIRVLCAVGVAPSLDAGRLFLVEKTGLRMLDPTSGLPRWSSDLGGPAVWAGYLADKLIAATSRQIVALELGQGTVAVALRSVSNRQGPRPARPVCRCQRR